MFVFVDVVRPIENQPSPCMIIYLCEKIATNSINSIDIKQSTNIKKS